MKKKYDADKYLTIQYSIIKGEVSQANSTLGIILSFIWGLLAIIVTTLLSVWLTVKPTETFVICWSIASGVLGIIALMLLIKSFRIFRELMPNLKRNKPNPLKNVPDYYKQKPYEERIKNFNPSYFATFEHISQEEFISLFDHKDDELTVFMLSQVYINGRIAYKKYKRASRTYKIHKL